MCIADLTGSINTELGNFNSVEMSMSAFESLAPYNWLPGTISKTTTVAGVINGDAINLAPNNVGVQIGMNWIAPNATPTTGVVTSINDDLTEIDVSPNISIALGEDITFSSPHTSCSIFALSESIQTKDKNNACVDFLFLFVGSGSSAPHGSPTTHIFTNDGFDFAVTPDQEILVWQGGATNQNSFIPANQLNIGTPIVSWANDIYQYVQVSSMSYEPNNSVAVNWTTTGTNSYQLENGIVLRGFIDDYCSCKPSASINDIPCESTLSYCIDGITDLHFSGSDSGGWEGGNAGEGTTLKSWSITPRPEDNITFTQTLNNFNQQMTMSIENLTRPSSLEVCYTESRILGPIEIDVATATTTSLGIVASDTCCFNLILNRQPKANFGSVICQTGFGTNINLETDLSFTNADLIVFSLASGSIGTFEGGGNSWKNLTLDPASHAKGKVTICYTASSLNPDCTNNADEHATINPLTTPNCCPAISGCSTVYFHPGFTAGQDGAECWPTMSLAGTSPIFTFTDTVISEPTWSLASGEPQFSNYESMVLSDPLSQFSPNNPSNITPFGNVTNVTNSYVTSIPMHDTEHDDLNFGWFTMSLQVSNGPCTFTDTVTRYVGRTFANAGPDRIDCVGFAQNGSSNNLPITPSGLIQLQATASSIDPPSGFWSYISPNAAFGAPSSPVIEETTNPESPFRIGICGGPATIQWTENSSSQITINGELYSIVCSDTDRVTLEKKKAKKSSKIISFVNAPDNNVAGETLLRTLPFASYTESYSQSHFIPGLPDGSDTRGPFTAGNFLSGDTNRISQTDNLYDINIFGDYNSFLFKFAYTTDPSVTRDYTYVYRTSKAATFPIPVYGMNSNINEDLMFRFQDNFEGDLHGTNRQQSSSTLANDKGILTESKVFMPAGVNNPSLAIHTSSIFIFSGSQSASFAAKSGSLLSKHDSDKSYYLISYTASLDDCNCTPAGTQARVFFRYNATDFRFATQSNNLLYTGSHVIYSGPQPQGLEPTIGKIVPMYKDIFALNFISESVVKDSTGSSVIYQSLDDSHAINGCAPFLSCSLPTDDVNAPYRISHYGRGVIPPTNKQPALQTNVVGNVWEPSTGTTGRGSAYPLSINMIDPLLGPVGTIMPVSDHRGVSYLNDKYPIMFRYAKFHENLGRTPGHGYSSSLLAHTFHENKVSGMANKGFGVNFKWKARQIAVYRGNGAVLQHGSDIPEDIITGSFLDTFSSESFIEAPTFMPALRSYSASLQRATAFTGYAGSVTRGSAYIDGLESGGDKRHVPYINPILSNTSYATIVTQSVMFECTASVHDYEGRLLKEYKAEQAVMFVLTSTT